MARKHIRKTSPPDPKSIKLYTQNGNLIVQAWVRRMILQGWKRETIHAKLVEHYLGRGWDRKRADQSAWPAICLAVRQLKEKYTGSFG